MPRLLLLPITLPLRIVRATAETSFGVARGVVNAVRPPTVPRSPSDDDVYATSAPLVAEPELQPQPHPEPEAEPGPEPVVPSLEVLEGDTHLDTEDELVAEAGPDRDAGPEIHVGEPWPGYDGMELDEVLARLGDASDAEVAIVRLYERQHENRQAVLLATGEEA